MAILGLLWKEKKKRLSMDLPSEDSRYEYLACFILTSTLGGFWFSIAVIRHSDGLLSANLWSCRWLRLTVVVFR